MVENGNRIPLTISFNNAVFETIENGPLSKKTFKQIIEKTPVTFCQNKTFYVKEISDNQLIKTL